MQWTVWEYYDSQWSEYTGATELLYQWLLCWLQAPGKYILEPNDKFVYMKCQGSHTTPNTLGCVNLNRCSNAASNAITIFYSCVSCAVCVAVMRTHSCSRQHFLNMWIEGTSFVSFLHPHMSHNTATQQLTISWNNGLMGNVDRIRHGVHSLSLPLLFISSYHLHQIFIWKFFVKLRLYFLL